MLTIKSLELSKGSKEREALNNKTFHMCESLIPTDCNTHIHTHI